MSGFGEKAVYCIAVHQLQPKSHAPRSAAYAAGQKGNEGVLFIHCHPLFCQLPLEAPEDALQPLK